MGYQRLSGRPHFSMRDGAAGSDACLPLVAVAQWASVAAVSDVLFKTENCDDQKKRK